MSDDKRSMKMVAVINCVINHNARAGRAAVYPGINHDVLDVLEKHGVGIIQMPCPEMVCLGLLRKREEGVSIRDILDTPAGWSCCNKLSVSVVDTIDEYLRNGYIVPAILGGDVLSPGCAVPYPFPEAGEHVDDNRYGVFVKALLDELYKRDIKIPIRGIRDSAHETLNEDLEWLDNILASC